MLTNRILLLLLYEEEQWIQILKYALTVVNHQQVYLTLIIQITHQSSDTSMTGREDLLKITLNVFFFFPDLFLIRCVHGRCIPLDSQSYRCECDEGYRGALCNQEGELFNPCRRLSCKHGRCQISDTGDAFCHCESGYTGELCDAGWFALTHLKMKGITQS